MTNTYAVITTRNREFVVEQEMREMGLRPWVPKALCSRKIPERKDPVWYDRPYVPKVIFCVIPAVYYRDVLGLKYVNGHPYALSRLDIEGMPAHTVKGTSTLVPAKPGLKVFKEVVEAEYAATERLRDLGEWECKYAPGQALEIIRGPFEGFPGRFQKTVKEAKSGHPMLKLHVELFGRTTAIEVAPDAVAC